MLVRPSYFLNFFKDPIFDQVASCVGLCFSLLSALFSCHRFRELDAVATNCDSLKPSVVSCDVIVSMTSCFVYDVILLSSRDLRDGIDCQSFIKTLSVVMAVDDVINCDVTFM